MREFRRAKRARGENWEPARIPLNFESGAFVHERSTLIGQKW